MQAFLLLLVSTAVGALLGLLVVRRRQRREPDELQLARWLDASLPWRGLLDAAQRRRHLQHTRHLARRVHFHGCAGLEVDNRMIAIVAGLAALLCLRQQRPMPQLRAVLLYPGPFWVPQDQPDEDGLVSDDEVLHSGLSEENGRVLLSWDDIAQALRGAPHNVAVHEFAHQLDALSGGEGAPFGAPVGRWTEIMAQAWERFGQAPSEAIDDYALEGPAEFFAVAVEAFFQRPSALHEEFPALYAAMAEYFGIDARRAHGEGGTSGAA